MGAALYQLLTGEMLERNPLTNAERKERPLKCRVYEWGEDANVRMTYDGDYSHQRFQVLGDRTSAMLYGISKGNDEIFRIYPMDTLTSHQYKSGNDRIIPEEIQNLTYLLPETDDDPTGEYLKVEYSGGAAYYSAETGERVEETPGQYRSEDVSAYDVRTKDYILRETAEGKISVIGNNIKFPLPPDNSALALRRGIKIRREVQIALNRLRRRRIVAFVPVQFRNFRHFRVRQGKVKDVDVVADTLYVLGAGNHHVAGLRVSA